MIMEAMSISSVIEHARENNINNKFLLPRKPTRQPNPIIYRKLRRGQVAAKVPAEKQIESPTDKELLRTIAYLRNATSVYHKIDKILSNNRGYIVDDEDDEWLTQSEEDIEDNSTSGKKASNNSIHILNKKPKRKSSNTDKANKESGISSFSHVVNIRDTSEHGKGLKESDFRRSTSTGKAFMQFCSEEIICPQEHRAALATKLYGLQAAMLSALGNPFQNLSQSITTSSSNNGSKISPLSLEQACSEFLPAVVWSGMLIVSFVYSVMVVWSLPFPVPMITMLCLALLYGLSVLVGAASGFSVMCGTFRMSGVLFASLGVLAFVLLLLFLVLLMLFAFWLRTKHDGEAEQ